MEFTRIERPPDWDEAISRYDTKTLFHESRWLDLVRDTHAPCQISYYKIHNRGEVLGYFCHVTKRKCGITLAGSPLPGAGMFGGPIVNHDLLGDQLVIALDAAMARDRVSVLTMCAESLKPEMMTALGFQATVVETHLRELDGGEAKVWATMHGTSRTRIRKAIKSGVTVESATDLTVGRELFDFYSNALARRGLVPSFDARHYESVLRHLGPDRVVSLRAKVGGRTIGAGLYLRDDRCIYYWDGASSPDHLHLSPNELMHWTAIQTAIGLGIPKFHMAGSPRPSRFTRKFGGRSVPYVTYRRPYLPLADVVLRAIDELQGVRSKIACNWRLQYARFTAEVIRPFRSPHPSDSRLF